MKRKPKKPSQVVLEVSPRLDKIPDDIHLAIIKIIQSWKKSEGTEDERERGKRARDSALSAVASSCRRACSLWQPFLMFDVTINMKSFFNFYLALLRNERYAKMIHSVTFTYPDSEPSVKEKAELRERWVELLQLIQTRRIDFMEGSGSGMKPIIETVYQGLPNIQTLIITEPDFDIPFQFRTYNGNLAPLPSLTQSLKKLHITMWPTDRLNFNARNVVWILVFCRSLFEVSIGCICSITGFLYLVEHSEAFSGLSNVQRLSLCIEFTSTSLAKRQWGVEAGEKWLVGRNRKTHALFNLLRVTKNLNCLELRSMASYSDTNIHLSTSCLSALDKSFHSLRHLRIFNFAPAQKPEERLNTKLHLFQHLKILSIDCVMALMLSRFPAIRLPPGLETLILPYFNSDALDEESDLSEMLKTRSIPNLKVVILPLNPVDRNGKPLTFPSKELKQTWVQGRETLKKSKVFEDGRVKLRFIVRGEPIGGSPEADFMSTHAWISPP